MDTTNTIKSGLNNQQLNVHPQDQLRGNGNGIGSPTFQQVHEQYKAHGHEDQNVKNFLFKRTITKHMIRGGCLRITKEDAEKCRTANDIRTEGKLQRQMQVEDVSGEVREFELKHWRRTGYVFCGEGWRSFRQDAGLKHGDEISFQKHRRDENRFFITFNRQSPVGQDEGRAASSVQLIPTGYEKDKLVRGKEGNSQADIAGNVAFTNEGQDQLEWVVNGHHHDYLGNAARENSIPSLPCHENNTGAFPNSNLVTDSVVFPSAALAQDWSDNEENLDQDSGDKVKRPHENYEEEARRNIRPNNDAGLSMLNFPCLSPSGMIANWPGETRAETNRSSLATTKVEEDQPYIWVSKTYMKALEERNRELEALLSRNISIREAQVQASQISSGVLPVEQSLPPHSSPWTEEDLNIFMKQTEHLLTMNGLPKWAQLSQH